MTAGATSRGGLAGGRGSRLTAAASAGAFVLLLCVVLDVALLAWISAGPPVGKTSSFFTELVVVLGGTCTALAAAALYPERARAAIPFLFLILAWHTGFQISLSSNWPSVISAFDVLIPVTLALAILGRWHEGSPLSHVDKRLWQLYVVFLAFAVWGLALAMVRGVDSAAMLQNAKSLVLYPLIVPLMIMCTRSWRHFYWVLAAMIMLVTERALEGVLHQTATLTTTSATALIGGQVVVRTSGIFASTNQYALYLMSGMLVVVALAVGTRSPKLRLALFAAAAIIVYGLTLALSRGAFIAGAVGLLLLVFLLPRRQAVGVVLLIIAALASVEILHPDTIGLVTGRFGFGDISTQQRVDYLGLGLQVIKHYPLGAGWGANFINAVTGLQPDYINWPWYHDDYLQLATEIGVAGLSVFLAIWFFVVRSGVRTLRTEGDRVRRAALAGLVVSVVGMLWQAATEQVFWRSDIAPHIWVVAGLLLAGIALVKQDAPTPEPTK